jgi:hypothetical protein
MLPHVRLQRLSRMADFAPWTTACQSAFRPTGTFEAAYSNNWRDAIENIVDAEPVAAYVRELMADRAQWTGSASTFCRLAPTGLAGQRARANSLAGCAGRRPSSAPSGSRLSSAARGC